MNDEKSLEELKKKRIKIGCFEFSNEFMEQLKKI